MISEVLNTDCLNYMKSLPDNHFDLAIADPPYGIGEDGSKNASRKNLSAAKDYRPYLGNDVAAPSPEFFEELFRTSRNQIIWGANHFIDRMPRRSSCWIVWDKQNEGSDFADCELAWTSFTTAVRKFSFRWNGMIQGNMRHKEQRIHPNQKPVALYAWLLDHYAKKGQRIFDPMMGSQSSRIAAFMKGYDYWGCEADGHYFTVGGERFERECHGIEKTKAGLVIQQGFLWP